MGEKSKEETEARTSESATDEGRLLDQTAGAAAREASLPDQAAGAGATTDEVVVEHVIIANHAAEAAATAGEGSLLDQIISKGKLSRD